MSNKGFISTSLLYSLFLVFILMITLVLSLYTNNRILLAKEKEALKSELYNLAPKAKADIIIGDVLIIDNDEFIVLDIINEEYYLFYNDTAMYTENHTVPEYLESLNYGYVTRLLTKNEIVKYDSFINLKEKIYVMDEDIIIYNQDKEFEDYQIGASIRPLIIASEKELVDGGVL